MKIFSENKVKPISVKLSRFLALSFTGCILAGFSSTALTVSPARAESSQVSRAEKYRNDGKTALDAGKYAKAVTAFGNALKQMDQDGQSASPEYLSTLVRLARALKEQDQLDSASQRINEAANLARKLGNGDPELQATFDSINALCKQVDIDTLGPGTTNALKSNSSTMTVVKDASGYKVTIRTPAKFDSSTGNDKVDMLGLDPLVTFSLAQDPDGTVRIYDVKGMRMHSVEKAMWVNFFGCRFGPQNEQSYRPSTISAGKMGVVKEVNRDLPPRIFAPVAGILAAISAMGQPVDPPLPVYIAPVEAVTRSDTASRSESTPAAVPAQQTETTATRSEQVVETGSTPATIPVVKTETGSNPAKTPTIQTETVTKSDNRATLEETKERNETREKREQKEARERIEKIERQAALTQAQEAATKERAARLEEERAKRENERNRRAEEHAKHEEQHRLDHQRHDKDHDDDDDDDDRELERERERERTSQKERERDLSKESDNRDGDKDKADKDRADKDKAEKD